MSSDGKIKSNREAKRLTRIRSESSWRDPSIRVPPRSEPPEPTVFGFGTYAGQLRVYSVSAELKKWIKEEADQAGISVSEWCRRVFEREQKRSEKQ